MKNKHFLITLSLFSALILPFAFASAYTTPNTASNPSEGGLIELSERMMGDNYYATATPNANYTFVNWTTSELVMLVGESGNCEIPTYFPTTRNPLNYCSGGDIWIRANNITLTANFTYSGHYYKCSDYACIQDDENGTYTEPTCNNECGTPPPPPPPSSPFNFGGGAGAGIAIGSSTDLMAYAGYLFSDLWPLLAVSMGIMLGFYVIQKAIMFVGARTRK